MTAPQQRFRVVVTRTDEYIVEFNSTGKGDQLDEKWMAEWRGNYYPFDDMEEHAEHIAQLTARFGHREFVEGYGEILYNGKVGGYTDEPPMTDINVVVVSEDREIEFDTKKLIT